MELILKRPESGKKDTYTIGKLYIDGVYFSDTLEDTDRGLKSTMTIQEIKNKKIHSNTAIPTGRYEIVMNIVSPKFSKYAQYNFINGKLPRLLNVPGYEGVLIHIGNRPEDTQGCILVGENKVKGQVINSTATFKRLYDILKEAKDTIYITIE